MKSSVAPQTHLGWTEAVAHRVAKSLPACAVGVCQDQSITLSSVACAKEKMKMERT